MPDQSTISKDNPVTPVKNLNSTKSSVTTDKKGTIRKEAFYQERDLQDRILELQSEYDLLKKEKDEEIEELQDQVEKLNQ